MSYYGGEYSHDCGFDEPDVRWERKTKDGRNVKVRIERDWFSDPDDPDEVDYRCTWAVLVNGSHYLENLDSEERAIDIAEVAFDYEPEEEDEEEE